MLRLLTLQFNNHQSLLIQKNSKINCTSNSIDYRPPTIYPHLSFYNRSGHAHELLADIIIDTWSWSGWLWYFSISCILNSTTVVSNLIAYTIFIIFFYYFQYNKFARYMYFSCFIVDRDQSFPCGIDLNFSNTCSNESINMKNYFCWLSRDIFWQIK